MAGLKDKNKSSKKVSYVLPSYSYVLSLSCVQQAGLVTAVAQFVGKRHGKVTETAQFSDGVTDRIFLRTGFKLEGNGDETIDEQFEALQKDFATIAAYYDMDWVLKKSDNLPGIGFIAGSSSHSLDDLLYRHRIGALAAEPRAVFATTNAQEQAANWHDMVYHQLDIDENGYMSTEDEAKINAMFENNQVEIFALGPDAPLLSNEILKKWRGRFIHAFHNYFPGTVRDAAKRAELAAFRSGVKLICATANYVIASDVDSGYEEGNIIIEQEAERIDHRMEPEEIAVLAREIEALVLARAVRYHIENRSFISDGRVVVFR